MCSGFIKNPQNHIIFTGVTDAIKKWHSNINSELDEIHQKISNNYSDGFLLECKANGEPIKCTIWDAKTSENGNVYTLGITNIDKRKDYAFVVLKYSPDGKFLWSKGYVSEVKTIVIPVGIKYFSSSQDDNLLTVMI